MNGDIDGNGNKVLFGNVYSALSDLPNASTYHGMFAHVHATGKGYFAHGGNWIELANNSQIPTVGDGGLSEINFTSADHTKLNGIEASATADQTNAEIRAAVEAATDSNVFTDADHTKLNNVSTTELYGENPSSATTPVAAGVNSVAIGDGASAGASSAVLDSLAIGTDAAANLSHGIAIGRNSYAGLSSVAIGSKSNSAGSTGANATWNGVAIGNNAYAGSIGATAIGFNAYAINGAKCFGEGYASGVNGTSLAINSTSTSYGASGSHSVAIGYASKATNSYSVAIGNRVWNTTANQISIGHGGGITGTPEKVQISESYTLPTADGTSGQVMTTNGSGVVSFTTVSGGGGGLANVVEDTSPQLGGDLDVNSKAINFGDSNGTTTNMLTFGAGGDLKMYHHATAGTYITENGTGNLNLMAGDLRLMNGAGSTTLQSQSSGIRISNSYTLPTADGTNGQVMTTDGSGAVSFADAGGGADLYAANASGSTAPSAAGGLAIAIGSQASAANSWSIAIGKNARANQNRAISIGSNATTTGYYSLSVGVDTTSHSYGAAIGYSAKVTGGDYATAMTKSHASGNNSFSAASNFNTSTYGSTAANTVAFGNYSKANASGAIAIGNNTIASSTNAVAIGYDSYAMQEWSVAIGRHARSEFRGKLAYSSGQFSGNGDCQLGIYVIKADTTDASVTKLTSDNATAANANQVNLTINQALSFHGTIVARQQASAGTLSAAWKVEGLIRKEANNGSTVLVNSAMTILDNTPNWGLALAADTNNGALAISVTGAANTNIRWVGTIHTSEVQYA